MNSEVKQHAPERIYIIASTIVIMVIGAMKVPKDMTGVALKTILITGGARGLGKALAFDQLAKGERVIVVDDSLKKGETFLNEAKQINAGNRAIFTQANLSLIDENERIADRVKDTFPVLDALAFCDSGYYEEYAETEEGFEFSFALNYVSRFVLSYELKECLEQVEHPVIVNVCATKKRGKVNWHDLQHERGFNLRKVVKHNGQLNSLAATAFVSNDAVKRIRYVLYDPKSAQILSVLESDEGMTKFQYRRTIKAIEKAVIPMAALLDDPPEASLSAYKRRKRLSLKSPNFNEGSAQRLYGETLDLLEYSEPETDMYEDVQADQ